MFTSNYYKILEAYQTLTANYKSLTNLINSSGASGTSITVLSFSGGYYIGGISLSGATQYNTDRGGSLYYLSNGSNVYAGTGTATSSPQYYGVILGDGDTPPTVNDYKLAGNMITDFTATTAVSTTVQDDKIVFTGTYNITNTGASTLTIKEYALRVANPNSSVYAIFNRGVFATPVVIEPGQTGIVTIEIIFQN